MTNIIKDFTTEAGATRYATRMSAKHPTATYNVITMGGTWYVELGS
jgi:hypothetical protein